MVTSDANCNDFDCKGPAVVGRRMAKLQPRASAVGQATATLLYEVWDGKQRTLQVKLPNAVTAQRWTHIAITARNLDAFQPALQFWINGKLFYTKEDGTLPRRNYTTNNYLGKSNWAAVTSQYENNDQLFKGRMFDFRVYKMPMTAAKIEETYEWGRSKLGLASLAALGSLSNIKIKTEPTVLKTGASGSDAGSKSGSDSSSKSGSKSGSDAGSKLGLSSLTTLGSLTNIKIKVVPTVLKKSGSDAGSKSGNRN
jgi:hypothetical protein